MTITNFKDLAYFSTSEDLLFKWEPDSNNDQHSVVINMILRSISKDKVLPSGDVTLDKLVF